MRIAVTGSTGFVGRHLCRALEGEGHEIVPLGRRELGQGSDQLADRLKGTDAVINLAGTPINRRWTKVYKRQIWASRVETTRHLVDAMSRMGERPAAFISTSAIGAYDGMGRYTETDAPNATDFLGRLAAAWEEAAREAEQLGIRTVVLRLALVLGHDGGLMKQLLLPFRLGLGGPIGSGTQHFSWVHVDDLVGIYLHALRNASLSGVYHACAPNPVTNREFAKALGRALHRPAILSTPPLALRIAFGEGADVMTSGQWVVSERLAPSGFAFRYPDLDSAVRAVVNSAGGACPFTGVADSMTRTV